MTKTAFFFDTYAFFEIIRGNPTYEQYADASIITTVFNIAELNYALKKEVAEKTANEYAEKYWNFVVPVTLADVTKATSLKRKHKDLSIPDVIGYVVAERHNVNFLTGDEGFRNLPNVEFVKK